MMKFPDLIVFDCDMCLWSPEMYELRSLPSGKVTSVIDGNTLVTGAKTDEGDVVSLFPGARQALKDYYVGKFPKNCRIAAASSADNAHAVRCAHKAMSVIEILPGVTMSDVFAKNFEKGFKGNLQIGRSGKLSSNKQTHFRELKKETGIEFKKMLFFDDCNWGDNCRVVGKLGVTTQKTPRGLTQEEFKQGLKKFAAE
jgi:magnesium-dependent phosphatase 1